MGKRLSPPFAMDRGRAQDDVIVKPRLDHPEWQEYTQRCREWLRHRPLTQLLRRLLTNENGIVGFNPQSGYTLWFGVPSGTPAPVGRSTSVAYVPGVTGAAVATRFITDVARTLSYCYFYNGAYSGTAALVIEMDYELRAEAAGILPDVSGAALASGTTTLSSAVGWIKGPTFNTSLTAMTPYWIICGDKNSPVTSFLFISSGGSDASETRPEDYQRVSSHRTSGGWASGNTVNGQIGAIIGVFSDGTAVGHPFTTDTTPTNDANEKGLYVNGVTEQVSIIGMSSDANMANGTGMKIYAAATSAGGTTLRAGTTVSGHSSARVAQGYWLTAPYTIPKSTAVRLVFYGSGNFNSPRKKQIGTIGIGSATDLQGAFPLGGSAYYTTQNGAGWTNDQTAFPVLYVWIQDQVAVTSGTPVAGFGQSGGLRSGGQM